MKGRWSLLGCSEHPDTLRGGGTGQGSGRWRDADLPQGHRADSPAKLSELPQSDLGGADVAAHLSAGATVRARDQAPHGAAPCALVPRRDAAVVPREEYRHPEDEGRQSRSPTSEIDMIGRWVDSGAPEGNPKDAPPRAQAAGSGRVGARQTGPDRLVAGDLHRRRSRRTGAALGQVADPAQGRSVCDVRRVQGESTQQGGERPARSAPASSSTTARRRCPAPTRPKRKRSRVRTRADGHRRACRFTKSDATATSSRPTPASCCRPAAMSPGARCTSTPSARRAPNAMRAWTSASVCTRRATSRRAKIAATASAGRISWSVRNSQSDREDAYFVAPQAMKLTNFEPHMHANGVRMCLAGHLRKDGRDAELRGLRPQLGPQLSVRGELRAAHPEGARSSTRSAGSTTRRRTAT